MLKVRTTCIYCGCGCQLEFQGNGEMVNRVWPVAEDPISRGDLCIKGLSAHEFVHHKDRLTSPMIRKNGKLEEVGWKEAIKYASDKLKEKIKKYGGDSIGVIGSAKCTNEDSFLLMKFARAVLKTNNIDNCARF